MKHNNFSGYRGKKKHAANKKKKLFLVEMLSLYNFSSLSVSLSVSYACSYFSFYIYIFSYALYFFLHIWLLPVSVWMLSNAMYFSFFIPRESRHIYGIKLFMFVYLFASFFLFLLSPLPPRKKRKNSSLTVVEQKKKKEFSSFLCISLAIKLFLCYSHTAS